MMAPAFSSTRQAAAFAALLLVLIALPAVLGKSLLPPREQLYSEMPWRYGPFSYIHREIYEEKGDIDVAFIGSSHIWYAIDTPYVQDALTQKLGRKAEVRTIAWAWLGFDALYFITQDLLQHRKVRMIVFGDEYRGDDVAHMGAKYWFRYGDNKEALLGLPLRLRASYYYASILGMPQTLLSYLRPNLPEEFVYPEDDHWQTFYHTANPAGFQGAMAAEANFSGEPFSYFVPRGKAVPADVSVYSPEDSGKFDFSGAPVSQWQMQFVRKFTALAREYNVKLVLLNVLPNRTDLRVDDPRIESHQYWPDTTQSGVVIMGIPASELFSGLDHREVGNLFSSPGHFNKSGRDYFTRIITPTLLRIYEMQTPH